MALRATGGRVLCDDHPGVDRVAEIPQLWCVPGAVVPLLAAVFTCPACDPNTNAAAAAVYYGYDLLLKIEYVGRTMYDCAGTSPPNPASNPMCTVVPPGGLAGKLHLQARSIARCTAGR